MPSRRYAARGRGGLLLLTVLCVLLPISSRAEVLTLAGTGADLETMRLLGDAFQQSPTRVDDWMDRCRKEYDPPAHISLRPALISGIEISLDRDRFDQAVRNVIDNACQAFDGATTVGDGAAECQVAVATRHVGRRLEVSISDNGVGISPQVMARVFEPLYSSKAFGVGLGLPLVRQIMEQHGGGVEITSEEGRGTEVVLWLPLERTADETAA